jgi:glycosyltransferase involved in cell wall biosynthesis
MNIKNINEYRDDLNHMIKLGKIYEKKKRLPVRSKEDLVSIITISKNSAKTLEKTILSVLSQKYSNIEYIIIDGGSNDGTLEIISKYDHKIDYWLSGFDYGPADAMNKGISVSRGSYIFWLGSDDWVNKDFLAHAITPLKESDHGYVYGNLDLYDENGIFLNRLFPEKNYAEKLNIFMPRFYTPSIVFKRECFEKFGLLDYQYKIANDYELLLRFHNNKINGTYIEKMNANHCNTGISNRFFNHALIEAKDVAINAKGPRIKIWTYFLFRLLKVNFKIAIIRFKASLKSN